MVLQALGVPFRGFRRYADGNQAAAGYGYSLLWVVLVANLIAMLFQALLARLGIVTGGNLAELFREHFPGPVVWVMWGISEVVAMATDLAEFLSTTAMLHAIYLHSGLTQDRVVTADQAARRKVLRFSNIEVALALAAAGLVNMAMVMMAASAFLAGHSGGAEIETAYRLLT
jgi:manganese transport protein